ncbi:unnamed protein product, partial [Mesorhabditis spiculigera]
MARNNGTIDLNGKKRVFIPRDYSIGIQVRFSTEFPEELIRKIDENAWKDIIMELNAKYSALEGVSTASIIETILGCASCYLIRCCTVPLCEKKMNEVGRFIDELNQDVLVPRGLYLSNPMERGLRCLEVTVLNEDAEVAPVVAEPVKITTPLQPRL